MPSVVIAAFYQFTELPDYAVYQDALRTCCAQSGVAGTILLASEGVNGAIAGPRDGIDAVLAKVRSLPGCAGLEHKESFADENPFLRAKVRLKKEIVTMGAPDVSPLKAVGDYVPPEAWNALLRDPDVVVIDTRNDYEVSIGTFEGAVNPHTTSFREFPEWFRKFREENPQVKKIAMFCTGGIRCEKATALAKQEGVVDVFHLKGGILKYLETVPSDQSAWRGECFVFDNRVSVGRDLAPGAYTMCHACRRPLSDEDRAAPSYIEGVSCPHCVDQHSPERRRAFAERQKQIELAAARGDRHLGVSPRRAPPGASKARP